VKGARAKKCRLVADIERRPPREMDQWPRRDSGAPTQGDQRIHGQGNPKEGQE
jgi:hypothetical protein